MDHDKGITLAKSEAATEPVDKREHYHQLLRDHVWREQQMAYLNLDQHATAARQKVDQDATAARQKVDQKLGEDSALLRRNLDQVLDELIHKNENFTSEDVELGLMKQLRCTGQSKD